jgi:hypothetical protein
MKVKSSEKEDYVARKDASAAKKVKPTAEAAEEGKIEHPLVAKEKEKGPADNGNEKEEPEEEEDGGILAGLLGGYDSADDSDAAEEKNPLSDKKTSKTALPSAADLLG